MKNYFCDSCLDGEVGILFRLLFWWQRKCPSCGDQWEEQREDFFRRHANPKPSPPPPPPKRSTH
jgi:hypothetical protein